MSRSKCSIIGCHNQDSQSITGIGEHRRFHVFPSSFDLCLFWVQNCGRRDLFEEFVYAGSEPFKSRHVCSDHFKREDFIDPKDKLSRILPIAVPSLNNFILKVDVNMDLDKEINQGIMKHRHVSSHISYWDILNRIQQDEENKKMCLTEKTENIPRKKDKNKQNTASRRKKERKLSMTNNAIRIRLKKAKESKEEKEARRKKDAKRAAEKRKKETLEQKKARQERDKLRARTRRQLETKGQAKKRRSKDAERTASNRKNVTEEQHAELKKKDNQRKAKRRLTETPEERKTRRNNDNGRKHRRKLHQRMVDQVIELSKKPEYAEILVPIKLDRTEAGPRRTTLIPLHFIVAECKDTNTTVSFNKLLQVVQFLHGKMSITRARRNCAKDKNNDSDSDVRYVGRKSPVQRVDLSIDTDTEDVLLSDRNVG